MSGVIRSCYLDELCRHRSVGGDRKWGTDGKYVGEFRGGLINGQGTLTFSSGAKYVGAFRDGKQTGQGIEYRADGSIIRSGIWENGSFISGR